MTRTITNLISRSKILLAAAVGATAIAAAPASSQARTDWRIGIDIRNDNYCRPPVYEERQERVWVEPVYRTVCERVWVEAQYRTVCDRVWVAPVTQDVCEQVWVPDRYENREVVRWYGNYRRVECVRVLVQPAHYEVRTRQIEVSPGYWRNIERRELVCDGHWQDVQRQEVVVPGHWEYRTQRIAIDRGPSDYNPWFRIEARERR